MINIGANDMILIYNYNRTKDNMKHKALECVA